MCSVKKKDLLFPCLTFESLSFGLSKAWLAEKDAKLATNRMNICEEFILILKVDGTKGLSQPVQRLETK